MNFFPTPEEILQEDVARQARWAHLTDNLKTDRRWALENALDNHKAMIASRGMGGVKMLETGTTTGNIATFDTLARPILRRIYADSILPEIASVQPMRLPTWKLFFIDFKYGSGYTPTAAGDRDDYEGGQFNHLYPTGAIVGEPVGTGDGTDVTFQLDFYPLVESSLVVRVASSVVTNYTVDAATGLITFAAAPANAATIDADYQLVMEGLGSAGNTGIPDVYLDMSSADVSATSWKIKASWTMESQQDLRAYHNLSIADELTIAQSRQIRMSIDRIGVLKMLAGATAGNTNWAASVPSGMLVKDHYETLVHAINDASLAIYKKRLRWANFVVMAPEGLNKLEKTGTFRLNVTGDARAMITDGPNVMGTLANRYTVIVDPQFAANKILVGYKGTEWNETGYVWSPYTTFMTDIFIDPNTMKPVEGMMQRGAHHLVNGDFYATVTIT